MPVAPVGNKQTMNTPVWRNSSNKGIHFVLLKLEQKKKLVISTCSTIFAGVKLGLQYSKLLTGTQ